MLCVIYLETTDENKLVYHRLIKECIYGLRVL